MNANSLSRGRVKRGINDIDGANRRPPQWQIGWLRPSIQQLLAHCSGAYILVRKRGIMQVGTCLIVLTLWRAFSDHPGFHHETRSLWCVIAIRDSHHILP